MKIMQLIGLKYLIESKQEKIIIQIKAIFNENGIAFGPAYREHKSFGNTEIRYSPSRGEGNALATMIYQSECEGLVVEIRHDTHFSKSRVKLIIADLEQMEELSLLKGYTVTYGGEKLCVFGGYC